MLPAVIVSAEPSAFVIRPHDIVEMYGALDQAVHPKQKAWLGVFSDPHG